MTESMRFTTSTPHKTMNKETADYLMNFVRETIVEALKVQYLDEEFAVGECSGTFDTHSMKVTLELTENGIDIAYEGLSIHKSM